ncbi:tetratricopeptide repeat protein [Cytobacillus oceanisediminis]|uniref:tetratricopeptide repeat protein n=1 Tax=Cytobacillus oceanisediminis TaxID=665099 RepID=UPI00203D25E3|nr:tetratricopeptide repeat protein [Cytobacillus oceanisediminis]MCM3401128.1 tetratricopeptide repeat protein [Cytobacillus oceanisediminis]
MRTLKIKDLTLDELGLLEQDLHENGEKSDYGYYMQLVIVYETMYKKLKSLARNNGPQYDHSLQHTKNVFVSNLIKFGPYIKMNHFKDDGDAVESLIKAIGLEQKLPIAYYRLGFLAYKHGKYGSAVRYFQQALNKQLLNDPRYALNQQQEFHAHMYLANSALYVASQTYETMEKLPYLPEEQLPNPELPPLFETLASNEKYLHDHAFYKITKYNTENCSKEACEDLYENSEPNELVLYFNERENILLFNGEEVIITPTQANMIRHFLLSSSKENPCTRITMRDFFGRTGSDGEVKKNTFIKSIERLRVTLRSIDIPEIIDVSQYRGETAYYFNESVPFTVLFRVDEAFANEYVS